MKGLLTTTNALQILQEPPFIIDTNKFPNLALVIERETDKRKYLSDNTYKNGKPTIRSLDLRGTLRKWIFLKSSPGKKVASSFAQIKHRKETCAGNRASQRRLFSAVVGREGKPGCFASEKKSPPLLFYFIMGGVTEIKFVTSSNKFMFPPPELLTACHLFLWEGMASALDE